MTKNEMIAREIYAQIGAGRFTAMTGAKNFVVIDNGLRFTIGRNASKANRVEIKLNGLDLYDVRFYRMTGGKMNMKTYEFAPVKVTEVKSFSDIYCDQLEEIFVDTTGLYTHF